MNPTYKGTRLFGSTGYDQRIAVEDRGGIAVPIPPLVDESTWNRVQDVLTKRKIRRRCRKAKEDDPYLLCGFLTCGHCHRELSTELVNGRRYYTCLRHRPKTAARLDKPVCDLTFVTAEPLEAELWQRLSQTLLDRDHLEHGLEQAQTEYQEFGLLRQDRLANVRREIDANRARLDRLTRRMVDIDDDELYQSQLREANQIGELVGKFQHEQVELEATPSEGLCPAEAQSVTGFAEDMGLAVEHGTPLDNREIHERIKVEGTLYVDPNGVRLTRRSRFRIDWKAAIPIRDSVTSLTSAVMFMNILGETV